MMMPRSILLLTGAFVTLCACTSGPTPLTEADIAAHREMSQQFLDHAHAKDWQALSEMYEEDAVVMQMNTPMLVGRKAIRDYWAAFPPIAELRFVDDGIVGGGDLVYVYGRYWLTFEDPDLPADQGKYLDVRRRQADGSWKYVAEAANSSLAGMR